MQRHALTNDQWKKIKPLIEIGPGQPSKRGERNFVNAVLWIAKTGAPWRDLPKRFGNWKTIYNRFRNWSRTDKWLDIFDALALRDDEVAGIIDGSIVRAHQDSSGGTGGPKKTRSEDPAEARQLSSTRSSTPRASPRES